MKIVGILSIIALLSVGCVPPDRTTTRNPRTSTNESKRIPARPATLPDSGTYFIVNNDTGQALQPNGPTLGQNVFLMEFTRGGTQKWAITRRVDPRTNQPTNRCTIRLANENRDLNFEPHPSVSDNCPILGLDKATFALELNGDGVVIKSVSHGGDALFPYSQESDHGEPRFAPNDGSAKFRWTFIRADGEN